MRLFMSGREFTMRHDPPTVQRAKEWLDKSKDGELFSTVMMADVLNVNQHTVKTDVRFMDGYTAGGGHGKMRYYGNPATIRELKRQFAKEGR